MAKDLPPLNALVVFISAAHNLSFTLAAEELCVTRSAVSRQIKLLEEYLGVVLFERTTNLLNLTEQGEQYLKRLEPVFEELKAATAAIKKRQNNNKLNLGISATFNATWLMGRLSDFYANHQDIDLIFHTNSVDSGLESVDFKNSELDAAIRLGNGLWPNCTANKLFDIYVQPVCSPALLASIQAEDDYTRISQLPWLGYSHLPSLWQRWLSGQGAQYQNLQDKNITYMDAVAIAVQAAINGLGIIPMYKPLAEPLLNSGQLVVAHPYSHKIPEAYYFVAGDDYDRHRPSRVFREWLLEAAGKFDKQRANP